MSKSDTLAGSSPDNSLEQTDIAEKQEELAAIVAEFHELVQSDRLTIASEVVKSYMQVYRTADYLNNPLSLELFIRAAKIIKISIKKLERHNSGSKAKIDAIVEKVEILLIELGVPKESQYLGENDYDLSKPPQKRLSQQELEVFYSMCKSPIEDLVNFMSAWCPKIGNRSAIFKQLGDPSLYKPRSLNLLRNDLKALDGFARSIMIMRYSDEASGAHKILSTIRLRLKQLIDIAANPNNIRNGIQEIVNDVMRLADAPAQPES